jgi:imidazolonepropionase
MLVRVRGIGRYWTPAGVQPHDAVLVDAGRVIWAGRGGAEPRMDWTDDVDAGGALLTPGLVDAHTHPVYAEPRFADPGGGILASVQATRALAMDELRERTRARLARWLAGGATTVEAKTGYHLTEAGELAAVRLLAGLAADPGLPRLSVTFLAAHAVPPEFATTAGADSADVFCDDGYFSPADARTVLEAARAAGLRLRLHADEFARTGGAALAAQLRVDSADHLLRISAADAQALAGAGVTATLCPVTALALGASPPVAALCAAGVRLALGSDHNAGTGGVTSMAEVVGLAVHCFGLSVDAALTAAAGDRDVVIWNTDHERAFAWAMGECRATTVILDRQVLRPG